MRKNSAYEQNLKEKYAIYGSLKRSITEFYEGYKKEPNEELRIIILKLIDEYEKIKEVIIRQTYDPMHVTEGLLAYDEDQMLAIKDTLGLVKENYK